MQKECATIATINTAEPKNPGIALMINFMPMECVKIAILIHTTEKEDKKRIRKNYSQAKFKVNLKFNRKKNDFMHYE